MGARIPFVCVCLCTDFELIICSQDDFRDLTAVCGGLTDNIVAGVGTMLDERSYQQGNVTGAAITSHIQATVLS